MTYKNHPALFSAVFALSLLLISGAASADSTSIQLLPPTAASGGTTPCSTQTNSLLTMAGTGTNSISAINCVTNATLDASGDLALAGSASVAGFLGIGTTTPTSAIDIYNAGGQAITLDRPAGYYTFLRYSTAGVRRWEAGIDNTAEDATNNNNYGSNYNIWRFDNSGNGLNPQAAPTILRANGNVGIGTATPHNKLEVVAPHASNGFIVDNVPEGGFLFGTPISGYGNGDVNFPGGLGTAYADREWSTDAKAGDVTLRSLNGGDINLATGPSQVNAAGVVVNPDPTGLQITTKVKITNSGNVGIGTTTPQGTLDVDNSSHNAQFCLNGTCVLSLQSQLNGYSVSVTTAAEWNTLMGQGVDLIIPYPRSTNDQTTANGLYSNCTITDPTNADGKQGNVANGPQAPACRNLLCTAIDPQHRWPIATTDRGSCSQGFAYHNAYAPACTNGTFAMYVGCIYGPDVSVP